jgi:hypothetical protein
MEGNQDLNEGEASSLCCSLTFLPNSERLSLHKRGPFSSNKKLLKKNTKKL